jgi:phosphoglycolate phosphatase-like HAD superfamily hydrolase
MRTTGLACFRVPSFFATVVPRQGVGVRTALVLDFDGVICDSIDECFAASWTAFHALYRKADAGYPTLEAKAAFARMRPFIRTGEDFVVIQDLLWRKEKVRDQKDFDDATRRAGSENRALFRNLFYQARTDLLERDRATWLGLNRIYPHMAAAFSFLPPGAPLFILSTKKPRFIAEILAAHGIEIEEERIFLSESEPKLAATERIRLNGGFSKAILVEDQIDAIVGNSNPKIHVYLASWGYVKAEWLMPPLAVPVLTPERFLDLVRGGDWSPSIRTDGPTRP